MEKDPAKLYCPNEYCQAANPLNQKFCQECGTPLPKRYLWVVGDGLSQISPGEILADRYLVTNHKFVLIDTRPGMLPLTPKLDDLPVIKAYLRLIPYRLHVPQVYGVLPLANQQSQPEILLLEKPPIYIENNQVSLCNQLTTAWYQASSIRQINWLWQIAHLWTPLSSEGVASSLFESSLLRVEGSLVRLLQFRFDSENTPNLSQLGVFWQQLIAGAQPTISGFVQQISQGLITGEINSSAQLITILDRGLTELGRSQTTTMKIYTKTDTGPSRQRNEDACYPPPGNLVTKPPQPIALAIVCDGIGGHEGGNVASNLAIETLQQKAKQLASVPQDHIDPDSLLSDLELAVALVNDKISQRNDSEKRQGRQRMGTTLVMALPLAHEMYVTHVGDSRAYWITKHGCYQVTLDDDVASREVRLGYSVYREAVQQGGAGSLVQALGMSPSSSLHPTCQRFILEEDAVFLLTSDGLTDFDRVEDYWETEILPILTENRTIENVTQKLVEIANDKNGHDNVTIALVHYQVNYSEPDSAVKVDMSYTNNIPTASLEPKPKTEPMVDNSIQKTKVIRSETQNFITELPLHWIILSVLALSAGGIGIWFSGQWQSPTVGNSPVPSVQNPPGLTPSSTQPPTTEDKTPKIELTNLSPGWVIKNNQEIKKNNTVFPASSFLEVIQIKPNPKPVAKDFLVLLRPCAQKGTSTTAKVNPVKSSKVATELWIKVSNLRNTVEIVSQDESGCDVSSPSSTSKPSDN